MDGPLRTRRRACPRSRARRRRDGSVILVNVRSCHPPTCGAEWRVHTLRQQRSRRRKASAPGGRGHTLRWPRVGPARRCSAREATQATQQLVLALTLRHVVSRTHTRTRKHNHTTVRPFEAAQASRRTCVLEVQHTRAVTAEAPLPSARGSRRPACSPPAARTTLAGGMTMHLSMQRGPARLPCRPSRHPQWRAVLGVRVSSVRPRRRPAKISQVAPAPASLPAATAATAGSARARPASKVARRLVEGCTRLHARLHMRGHRQTPARSRSQPYLLPSTVVRVFAGCRCGADATSAAPLCRPWRTRALPRLHARSPPVPRQGCIAAAARGALGAAHCVRVCVRDDVSTRAGRKVRACARWRARERSCALARSRASRPAHATTLAPRVPCAPSPLFPRSRAAPRAPRTPPAASVVGPSGRRPRAAQPL